jgi:hypothetical protein
MPKPPRIRWLGVLLLVFVGASFAGIGSGQVITEFPVPTASSQPPQSLSLQGPAPAEESLT